jgi:RecA-family ATPase
LHEGDKLLISSKPKAGKSFLVSELALAIATGKKWLGHQCAKGAVLYVNFEIKPEQIGRRLWKIMETGVYPLPENGAFEVWNLRGEHYRPLEDFTETLIGRMEAKQYKAVILDPFYKLNEGVENAAEDVEKTFTTLDRITLETGAALIYVHHDSKGLQYGKASFDRSSGSGVFARDPDLVLSMVQLDISEALDSEIAREKIAKGEAWLEEHGTDGWEGQIRDEAYTDPEVMQSECRRLSASGDCNSLIDHFTALEESSQSWRGWELEGEGRNTTGAAPIRFWFKYPIHEQSDTLRDADYWTPGKRTGSTDDKPDASALAWAEKFDCMDTAYDELAKDGYLPSLDEWVDACHQRRTTFLGWITKNGKYEVVKVEGDKRSHYRLKSEGQSEPQS